MTSSWHAPAVAAFVERLPELTKTGRNRTKGHKHFLAPCDVCWEATWVHALDAKGIACRMTHRCSGRHRREGLVPAIVAGPPRCAVCRDRDATAMAVHRKTGDRWPSCSKCRAQAERYRVPVEFSDLRAEEAA